MCLFLYSSGYYHDDDDFLLYCQKSKTLSLFFFHEMDSAYYSILCNKEKLSIVHLNFLLSWQLSRIQILLYSFCGVKGLLFRVLNLNWLHF